MCLFPSVEAHAADGNGTIELRGKFGGKTPWADTVDTDSEDEGTVKQTSTSDSPGTPQKVNCIAISGNQGRRRARKAKTATDYNREIVELESGGIAQASILSELRGKVRSYTLHPVGCRVIQRVIELCGHDAIMDLVAELRGFTQEAMSSPHGNYVVQKVVEVLPAAMSGFVAEELIGVAVNLAFSKFGCRVLCRLFEHAAEMPSTIRLWDEALRWHVEALCCHEFGHHVVEAVLEHGMLEQKSQICEVLRAWMSWYAVDYSASFVVETALKIQNQPTAGQRACIEALIQYPEQLICLAEHENGFRAVRGVLNAPASLSFGARSVILQHSFRLKKSKPGSLTLSTLKKQRQS